jgi:acetyl esterase/lipase
VNAALGFLTRHYADFKIDPANIVLAGDSAGAHMAGQVALITTDPAYATAIGISPKLKPGQISGMLLLSGAFDPTSVNFEGNYGWFLKAVLWAYSGAKNFREDERFQLMSVTRHVTKDFPPSFISTGNGDPLAPQAVALVQKLEQLGVRVDSLFFPSERKPPLRHEYQFNLDDPAGREALNRMLAFLEPIRSCASAGRYAPSPSCP